MTTRVYVYTANKGGQGAWSRYLYPFDIEAFEQLGNDLYIRHGNRVSRVDEAILTDVVDGTPQIFPGTVQWPWLDFGQPGVSKAMESFDIVGTGFATVSFGFNQSNTATFSSSYDVFTGDSMQGNPIPFQLTAPTISEEVTFAGGLAWSLQSLNLHLHDNMPGA